MFDIGFSEILVIAVVALIVIGPERLPKVARTLGHLFGRMQRYVNDVKADISREMELDELRKLQATMQDAARSVEQTVNQEISATESEFKDVASSATDLTPAPQSDSAVDAVTPVVGIAPTSQLELGLEASNPATPKAASR